MSYRIHLRRARCHPPTRPGCPADQRGTAMQTMGEDARRVIGGVDAHADTHHAAALYERGALLETKSFSVSAAATANSLPAPIVR
jgi:hypothetical protein